MPDPNLEQLNYHVPEVSTMYDAPLLRKKRAIGTKAGQRAYLKMPLLDNSGANIDLTQYNIHTGSGSAYLQYALNNGVGHLPDMTGQPRVMARYSEATGGNPIQAQVTAEVLDAPTGLVMCEVPLVVSQVPGVYLGELAIIDPTNTPIYSNECYVYNEGSGWSANRGILPALDEMRLSLRDNDPAENELIENYDFGLPELCYAVVRTVRFWNSQPPWLQAASTCGGIPSSEIMMLGTQLYLFELAEEHYRRNRLPYAAGQTQLDDKAKEENYNKAYTDRMTRFRQLVMHTKAAMNMNRGWGGFVTNYGGVGGR
jgi:hypothetical protein